MWNRWSNNVAEAIETFAYDVRLITRRHPVRIVLDPVVFEELRKDLAGRCIYRMTEDGDEAIRIGNVDVVSEA